jgi:hypothetical protein
MLSRLVGIEALVREPNLDRDPRRAREDADRRGDRDVPDSELRKVRTDLEEQLRAYELPPAR